MNRVEFKYLKIINFRSISELEVEFTPSSIILIKGKNGSGKSSIFNAIYTCLYNRQINGRPASKAVKNGTTSSALTLVFTVNGIQYVLNRVIGKGAKVSLESEGENPITGNKIKNIIEEMIPPDLVKLSMLKKVNIKDIISGLVNVESFTKKLQEELKNCKLQKEELLQKVSDFDIKNQSLNSQIDLLKQEIETLSLEKLKIESELKVIDINLTNEELLQKQNRLQLARQEYERRTAGLEQSLNQEMINDYENPRNEILNLLKYIDTKLNELLAQLNSEIQKVKNQEQINLKPLEQDIEYNNREIEKIKKLIETKVCYACNREIDGDDLQKYQDKIKVLEKTNQELYNKITSIKEETKKQVEELEYQKQDYIQRATKRKQELQQDLQILENKKLEIEQKRKDLDHTKSQIWNEILCEMQIPYEDLNINFQELLSKVNRKNTLLTQLESINNQINHKLQLKNQLEKDLHKIVVETNIRQTQNKLKDLEFKIQVYETWNNTRLLKKLLVKRITQVLNHILTQKYSKILKVFMELDENDNVSINVQNTNGDIVSLEDVSTGESVIALLTLYSGIRDLLVTSHTLTCLNLDEFLDSLDDINVLRVLKFLKDLCTKTGITIMLITHREDIRSEAIDYYDTVIDMDEI